MFDTLTEVQTHLWYLLTAEVCPDVVEEDSDLYDEASLKLAQRAWAELGQGGAVDEEELTNWFNAQ